MADPSTYRPRPGEIPESPGVYRFLDSHGRVVYVGKAKNLRSRLSSYFGNLAGLHQRTQQMVTTAASVDWTVVSTEVESLALEYAWIKEFDPRFNVKYRDDKSYPFLAVTMGEEFPRVQVMRGAKRPGTRYFGPYSHAWAIRETVDLLLRVFPIRSCSAGVFKRAKAAGRPCLLGYIGKCAAPCVGWISPEEHRDLAEDFCDFMAGNTAQFERRLEAQMRAAAAEQDYERAARLRDDLGALRKVVEKNAVVLPDGTDADVFAMAADELEASVQVFHVRGGRIRGQRGWVTERVEDLSEGELVERLLQQVYGGTTDPQAVPREVIVPAEPDNLAQVQQWLRSLRGANVSVRVARRGDKRRLAETVEANAQQALALHKTRRAGDLTARSHALAQLQEHLDLPTSPLRIECYDISHTAGSEQVASMVVFEDGLARKSEYRHFVVRGAHGDGARDDTEAMYEVLSRRFRRYLAGVRGSGTEDDDVAAAVEDGAPGPDPSVPRPDLLTQPHADPGSTARAASAPDQAPPRALTPGEASSAAPAARPQKRFAYPPQLVVVDGGAPQVAAAVRALDDLGIGDVSVVGLAKRLEEVWLPGEDYPLVLPRTSDALFLLQRIRDEAHRFAIAHHRKRRSKAMTRSVLDAIPGLGPARQQALLTEFGSVKKLRAASVDQILAVPGIGPGLARTVHAVLNPDSDEDTTDPGGPGGSVAAGTAPPSAATPGTGGVPNPPPGGDGVRT
ncbi:excinuclease ABC subunit UvrC [Pseudactinotalea sp. Z1732]|uniref:excinuclease ABC subunit UvrC n=1 Tax=Pseudactinotalea sp. Z1732 TaxID=3413026 RepID=UPI003C7A50AD